MEDWLQNLENKARAHREFYTAELHEVLGVEWNPQKSETGDQDDAHGGHSSVSQLGRRRFRRCSCGCSFLLLTVGSKR